ncbi:MAG: hypothetical protein HY231_07425 [Acidobacteria bacterium]|nr:hypothetical protein [Acidobacteriota bacterium]
MNAQRRQADLAKAEANRIFAPYTILESWVERSRLSWPKVNLLISILLLLPLLLTAYLDGVFALPFAAKFWRVTLLGPAVVIYIFATHPQIRRLRREAIEAFRSLVKMPAEEFNAFVDEYLPLDRRREWAVFFLSALFGEFLLRPWTAQDAITLYWSKGYRILLTGIMCGLIGTVIYTSLTGARFLARLHRRPLNLNVFDMTPLEPIAQRSLFYALVLIGGITLGLFFIPSQDMRGVIINGVIILAAISIFFLSMRDTHAVMRRTKLRELRLARQHLAVLHNKLQEETPHGHSEALIKMAPTTNAWLTYEKRIDQAPEWPFTSPMLRKLLVSILVPITLFILQRVVGELLAQWIVKK